MTETTHPAIAARRQRLHRIRVRIAAAAVGMFIAVFSVIYAQMPATARTTKSGSQTPSLAAAATGSSSSATQSSPTPMTTSQS